MLAKAPDNRAVALKLAAAGYFVFPCEEADSVRGKAKKPKPQVYWLSAATTDANKINRWWDEWPDALVGLNCGKSGFFVTDADRHGGPDGVTAWEALIAKHGDPGAPSVSTPSNGVHYYFRQPEEGEPLGNREKGLPAGINIRGKGGYVIAPGTTMPDGRIYEMHGDIAHAPPIPGWLIDIITIEKVDEIAPPKPAVVQPVSERRITAYAQSAVDGELNVLRAAGEGTRNETLNKAAFALGTMAGAGWISRGAAQGWLADSAAAIGLPKSEAAATIRSGLTAGMKEPRGAPEDTSEADSAVGAETVERLTRPKLKRLPSGDIVDEKTGEIIEDAPKVQQLFEHAKLDWQNPGGLLGEITEWILETTPRTPNRPLAVAAAIVTIGTLCGRHLGSYTGSGTHLYVACVGQTAIGKDRPLNAPKQILTACKLGNLVTSGAFKSDTAVENALHDSPCCLAIVDEIGTALFSRMSSKRATSHESGISGVLRVLWQSSFGSYQTSNRAAKKSETIDMPALSIFGASTASELYNSLGGGSAIDNGFLNRFLFIQAAPRERRTEAAKLGRTVPQAIIDKCLDVLPFATGNFSGGAFVFSGFSDVQPQFMATDADAEALFDSFENQVLNAMDSDAALEGLLGRTAEIALRLATIHAVSRAGRNAVMNVDDMRWGMAASCASTQMMVTDIRDRMSENAYQANYKFVLRLLQEAGKLTKSQLTKRIHGKIPKKETDEIVKQLEEAGEINVKWANIGSGFPTTISVV